MDVTPLVPKDRQVIESYSAQGFRVSGVFYAGAIIVLPQASHVWPIASVSDIALANLTPVLSAGAEILLLGCGRRIAPIPAVLRHDLRAQGIAIDAMDTGAACRTYSILLTEARRVAAALFPVG